MKRLITLFILVAMVLTIFAGCQFSSVDATQETEPSGEATEPSGEPFDPDILFTEVPTQGNLKAIYDKVVNDVVSDKYLPSTWYYGAINDCIVVFLEGNMFWFETISVADCEFRHSQSFDIYVYKDGENCKLEEAYEKGWLTKEHIEQLEARHSQVVEELRKAQEEYSQSKKETQGE